MSENGIRAPSTKSTDFNCPHCGALAEQFWYSTHATGLDRGATPMVVREDVLEEYRKQRSGEEHQPEIRRLEILAERAPVLQQPDTVYNAAEIGNLSISRCHNCDCLAVWIHSDIAWPKVNVANPANPDLPQDIAADYREASAILDSSPRGAAALLRYAIQNLCKHLGANKGNINDDIGYLVGEGLDIRIQRALDIVRVVGNNSVHPGQLDMRDDRETATRLFDLINLIAERMISEPKHIDQMYEALPEADRKKIAKRDQAKGKK